MSIANEPHFAMDQLVETNDESKKKPRILYTREFLLSFSDKEICKKMPNLPNEFTESLFIDSEDPPRERVRLSGDFSSHGLRGNDYSSSPPTRGDFCNNSRGFHGRGRSGGWSDKDSDSQSDRDSESGRRAAVPSRPWQAPEHDGLLGKGSFPKPPGFGAATSGSKDQTSESYQLRRSNEPYRPPKSNEPYQPPRPYKAGPYTRRDTRDTFNDETFGSSDSTNEDRAEEERKRRASFESLRKEHQKSFQERQKSNPDLHKKDFDFSELVGESQDDNGRPSRSNEVNNTTVVPGSNNAPRPLVPPGFASPILGRKQGEKPQIEASQHESSSLNFKAIDMVNETPSGSKISSSEMLEEGEDVRVSSTDASKLAVNTSTVNFDKSFVKLSSTPTTAETQGYPEKNEFATMTVDKKKSLEISDEPSILDKLFINLNTGESSNITVKNVEKVEEKRSPDKVTSKFAHLFLEEDDKPDEDLPSTMPPTGLLSLLQSADDLQTADTNVKGKLPMDFPFQGHATKNTDQLNKTSTSKPVTSVPPVLTCEDLEHSILSEVSESYHPPPPLPPVDKDLSVSSVMNIKQRKPSVDNQASQLLLSLLQRGDHPNDQETPVHSVIDSRPLLSPVKPATAGEADPGKSLTLENLFGSAFMNELQSIGEPVSGRPIVSDTPGAPLRSDRCIGGELNQRNQIRPEGLPGGLLGGLEDGNLLSLGDPPAYPHKYMPLPGFHSGDPEVTFNISDKLAALNSGPRNERPTIGGQDGHFLRHHPQQYATGSSSHMNGSGPVFNPFDSRHTHIEPQLDFMGQGNNIIAQHQDPPLNHRFPPNMIHRPAFHPEFDRLPPHMIQKMHMQDNLQHNHLMQGFPGGGPQHHHSPHLVSSQMQGGLIAELNASQGFPFAQRQPNYGMPPPGSQVNRGGDHQASLQTLLGIHQRMDPSKQMGQAGGPNRQGSMGQEFELGFGYR